jgi:3'-phosphoadenosine 5'-phosphosulfate sulfotransferase (PAPS reductase)/FAD synthetase
MTMINNNIDTETYRNKFNEIRELRRDHRPSFIEIGYNPYDKYKESDETYEKIIYNIFYNKWDTLYKDFEIERSIFLTNKIKDYIITQTILALKINNHKMNDIIDYIKLDMINDWNIMYNFKEYLEEELIMNVMHPRNIGRLWDFDDFH